MGKMRVDPSESRSRRPDPDYDYVDDSHFERQRVDRIADKNFEKEQETRELIEEFLRRALKEPGDFNIDERIEFANRLALEARDSNPGVEKYRNAEYYLMALSAGAKRDPMYSIALGGIPLYDALKSVAIGLKDMGLPQLERVMRSGDGPLSRPGAGAEWARKGLREGWRLPGQQQIHAPRERDMQRPGSLDAPDMQKPIPLPKR